MHSRCTGGKIGSTGVGGPASPEPIPSARRPADASNGEEPQSRVAEASQPLPSSRLGVLPSPDPSASQGGSAPMMDQDLTRAAAEPHQNGQVWGKERQQAAHAERQ
jgi:hypothetical protein